MNSISCYLFTDPFITPGKAHMVSPTPSNSPQKISPRASNLEVHSPLPPPDFSPPKHTFQDPIFATSPSDIPAYPVIVYRGKPTGISRGPDIAVPFLNIAVNNSMDNAQVIAKSISTYPDRHPYNPIADRFEIRFTHDSWTLALADGCGLTVGSRLAPLAAINGFWNHLSSKIAKHPEMNFDTSTFASYITESLSAAHINIYWEFYSQAPEGLHALESTHFMRLASLALKNKIFDADEQKEVIDFLTLPNSTSEEYYNFGLQLANRIIEKKDLIEDCRLLNRIKIHNTLIRAKNGDYRAKKRLLESILDEDFFTKYITFIGSTTFLCASLLKSSSSTGAPFNLVTVNIGDSQAFLFRDGKLQEFVKTSRQNPSDIRDTGGRIGFCSKTYPFKLHIKNIQFSMTPCYQNDLLFFMTDGVLDNLDPERLCFPPNKNFVSEFHKEKLREATHFTNSQLDVLFDELSSDATSWEELSPIELKSIKSKFLQKLLELIISKNPSPEQANQNILNFCNEITRHFREGLPTFSNELWADMPNPAMGKPDHTTCLTFKIP